MFVLGLVLRALPIILGAAELRTNAHSLWANIGDQHQNPFAHCLLICRSRVHVSMMLSCVAINAQSIIPRVHERIRGECALCAAVCQHNLN